MKAIYGAVEAGGTKFVVAAGRAGEAPLREARIPTTNPEETLGRTRDFFQACFRDGLEIRALGIGSFGPVELDPGSPRWGYIASTPKPGWRDVDIAGILGRSLGVPVGFDTDVNAAALAESRLGEGRGRDPVVYITVGTGIGGGAVVNGKLLHGRQHPEMGHIRMERRADDSFGGVCPYHGTCWEGLASGPAIEARWGARGETLPPEHPAWDLEAWYIAQGVLSVVMILSPDVVVLGGGIPNVPGLLEKTREYACGLCSGYLADSASRDDWQRILRSPALENPGRTGAFLLAQSAERSSRRATGE